MAEPPDRARPPRLRDLPGPRENPSVIGPLFRWLFQWPYRFALAGLARAGFRPWQLTVLSLVANGVVAGLLLTGRRLVPGLLLLAAGLFDVFDGGVARLRGEASRKGALLDSVIDRASDGIVFTGIFLAEATIHHRPVTAALALSAMVVSLLVSHVRAEGEAAGLELLEGTVQRLERYVALVIGLSVPGALLPVLAFLTAGVLLLMSRLRLGIAADFLSSPAMLGFMNGAAVVIVGSQIGKLCGTTLNEDNTLLRLWEWLTRLANTRGSTLGIGLACIAVLAVCRWKFRRVPGAVVVFVLAFGELGVSILVAPPGEGGYTGLLAQGTGRGCAFGFVPGFYPWAGCAVGVLLDEGGGDDRYEVAAGTVTGWGQRHFQAQGSATFGLGMTLATVSSTTVATGAFLASSFCVSFWQWV